MKELIRKISKKTMAFIFSFVMLFNTAFPSMTVFAQGGYQISFEATGTHTMAVDNGTLKIDNVPVVLERSGASIGQVSCDDATHCRIAVADDSQAGELKFTAGGAFKLYNTNGHTEYVFGTEMNTNQVFKVEDSSGGGDQGTNTTSTVAYNYTGERAEITVNGGYFDWQQASGMGDETGGTLEGDVNYNWESGKVEISVDVLFIFRLTSLTINGTDYSLDPAFPNTPAKLLQSFRDQGFHYVFEVDKADTYNISTVSTETTGEYMVIGNFLWSYMDKDKGTDDYVGNGTFELVEVSYGGDIFTEQDIRDLDYGYLYWNQDSNEGAAVLPAGATITVKLIPDAGYQLTSFTINGGEFEAGNEVGTYTFEVPRGNFHLGASFTKVANKVDSDDSDIVSSGTIKLGGNEESMSNGTAKLEVSDVDDLTDEEKKEFADAAGNYDVKNFIDISLFNTIYKGSAAASWDTQVDELNHKATITLKLAKDVDGNEVVIVHQKHDGTYEVIETTYDPVTHTITFTTDSFSNYAIASKKVDKSNPKTGDNIELYFILLGIGLFGLALNKKRRLFN